jgi:hypothetical protein
MYALRSVGVHVVPVAFWSRLVIRGGYWFVRLLLERGGEGGEVGRALVDKGPLPRVTRDVGKIGGFVVVCRRVLLLGHHPLQFQ